MKKLLTISLVLFINHEFYASTLFSRLGKYMQSGEFMERLITTSVIGVELIILLLIVYFWKRSKTEKLVPVKTNIKTNIRALRNERLNTIIKVKSDNRRKDFVNSIDERKVNAKSITSTAKKLSVSKGELFLAAKLKQLSK